ncbi:hypothetical protein ACWGCW_41100, partial [Streptomyces sp. NPDC054933]
RGLAERSADAGPDAPVSGRRTAVARTVKRSAAFTSRLATPLYILAVVGTIAFVLYVGATANRTP